MIHIDKLLRVLDDIYEVECIVNKQLSRIEGASSYIAVLITMPHEDINKRWALRITPLVSFSRWSSVAKLELFFDSVEDMIGYLKDEQTEIWRYLFKCLTGDYDDLVDCYNALKSDLDDLYFNSVSGLKRGIQND